MDKESLLTVRRKEQIKLVKVSGRKPIQCSRDACRRQCQTPCLGTPADILLLCKEGYSKYLKPTEWAVSVILGKTKEPLYMIQLFYDEDKGMCCMYENGLCRLHEKGLKPLEGKLSSHQIRIDNYDFNRSLSWNIAKEWMNKSNADIIEEILTYFD